MEQYYLTREAEQEAAFLSKLAKYRGSSTDSLTPEADKVKSNQVPEAYVPASGSVLLTNLTLTVVLLWLAGFFFPLYAAVTSLFLIPIFKLTRPGDNWRYGAYFVISLSALLSLAALVKIIGAALF